ncbi:MAG: DUF4296 domain-containing protein [Bacteroidota bacterium]
MRYRVPTLLLIVSVIAFSGCNKRKSISGKEFIPQEVLVDVLVDIHMVDGITNDRKFHRRYDADSIDLLNPILDKYGITQVMFDTTMTEYSRNPDLLDQVYNEVLIKLNVMLDENDKENRASKPAE